jgi:hypothetical protein
VAADQPKRKNEHKEMADLLARIDASSDHAKTQINFLTAPLNYDI